MNLEPEPEAVESVAVENQSPRLIECGASVSEGGRIQIKKYEFSSDYHFSLNAKWEMPDDMTDDEAAQFRHEQILRLKSELEGHVQAEVDNLLEQKEQFKDYRNYDERS
jgi:hypothetical protein